MSDSAVKRLLSGLSLCHPCSDMHARAMHARDVKATRAYDHKQHR
jgi:hypothetical protein